MKFKTPTDYNNKKTRTRAVKAKRESLVNPVLPEPFCVSRDAETHAYKLVKRSTDGTPGEILKILTSESDFGRIREALLFLKEKKYV